MGSQKFIQRIFNPFITIAGWPSLFIGLIAIGLAGYIGSFSNTHFDGVLDTHSGAVAPFWLFFTEGFINWICLSITLWISGRIFSKTSFRTIDLVGTQAMARTPTLLIGLTTLLAGYGRFTQTLMDVATNPHRSSDLISPDAFIFGFALLIITLATCWMVRLMYVGYAISCNLKGGRAIGSFIVALISAEIVSKILIVLLLNYAAHHAPNKPNSAHSETRTEQISQAVAAAEAWLTLIDNEKYAESWDSAASLFQQSIDQHQWVSTLTPLRPPMGSCLSRKVKSHTYLTELPKAGKGEYIVIQFTTSFANKKRAIETVTPMMDNGTWKVSGYYIK